MHPVAHLFLISYFFLLSKNPQAEVKISEEGIVKKEEVKIPNALAFGIFGVPEGIRTSDLPLRRRSLYPTELLRQIFYTPYYIL